MTTVSSAPLGDLPVLNFSDPLLALVRLLARETARTDFATRCNNQNREICHD
jgi:hypothetical protein